MNGVEIPQAAALLHADCSGKVVNCEISQYFFQTRPEAIWFMANVQVSKQGPSVSMVMKTVRDADEGAVQQLTLNLLLSLQRTVRTTGEDIKSKHANSRKKNYVSLKGQEMQ